MGFPTLQSLRKVRVEQANLVYSHTASIVRHAAALNIQCSIENPQNSLFWIAALMKDFPGYNVVFDNCCHGGLRKKASRGGPCVDGFISLCDGNHFRASWKQNGSLVHPTAEEATYPALRTPCSDSI